MTPTVSAAETERFRTAIAEHLGLRFNDDKLAQLAEVLQRRADAVGVSATVYLSGLERHGPDHRETAELARELTVPETYFFRNLDQYRALREIALPTHVATQAWARRLRVLSAGCASGEEAYSLGIVVREAIDPSWNVTILGVDLNPAVIRKAGEARYSAWALRETPAEVRQRWFTMDGREAVLAPSVRDAVRFEVCNLIRPDARLWAADSYDVVFFRNVLMYLTGEHQRLLLERLARAIRPGGYLFLGHAENLRGLSAEFHLCHTHNTFYYQRRDPGEARAAANGAAPDMIPAVFAAVESADSWVDAIHKATARIEALMAGESSRSADRRAGLPAAARPARAAWNLDLTLELLREERFEEAIAMMQRLPPESSRDADALLLNAALHTHGGRLDEAERICHSLLEVDDLNAGAHYLLALCREGAGDRPGAVHHDRVAGYLDPGFAMPHLHLGLLARREGDCAAAQRELEQALLLLGREDGSRLLLFGGGFTRETLLALCRTELAACASTPVSSRRR